MDLDSWPGPPDALMDHAIPPTAVADKKPRHRHTPSQLESLNELFARAEHPSLDDRSSLAQRLGMCVAHNAFFVAMADKHHL